MLFIHTIEQVLAQKKRQTSRLWKPDYVFSWSDYEEPNQIVLSQKAWDAGKIRRLYYVGQELAVQAGRGQKGIARIRITELAKRDVRDFTEEDIRREGFESIHEFLRVWVSMHDKWLYKKIEHFSQPTNLTGAITDNRPDELYTALVIRFELVAEQKAAA